jgi:hypothetical protein
MTDAAPADESHKQLTDNLLPAPSEQPPILVLARAAAEAEDVTMEVVVALAVAVAEERGSFKKALGP